jgi:hypothetical protein
MKKQKSFITLIGVLLLGFMLIGCSSSQKVNDNPSIANPSIASASPGNVLDGVWEGVWYSDRMHIVFNENTTSWYGGWADDGESCNFIYENGKYMILDDEGNPEEIWSLLIKGDYMYIIEDEFFEFPENISPEIIDDDDEYGVFKRIK